jgi:predicted nucleic acid-binding protein
LIVVDASTAVKWFLPEAGSEEAERLLTGSRKLLAPDLIRIEVAGALVRRVCLGELTVEQARLLVAAWLRAITASAVTPVPAEDDMEQAVELALRLGHPLADCLYLALAMRLDAPLVTADRKFAARAVAVHPGTQDLVPR